MVTADQLDLPMDFDSLKKAGTGLGSAGVIVVDDATCMVAQTLKFSSFFKAESCGQCPPCRMGTINLAMLVDKIERGEGTQKDLDTLLQVCGFVKGTGYCTLVTGAAVLVQSSLRLFRHEFEEHIRLQRCPFNPAQAGRRNCVKVNTMPRVTFLHPEGRSGEVEANLTLLEAPRPWVSFEP